MKHRRTNGGLEMNTRINWLKSMVVCMILIIITAMAIPAFKEMVLSDTSVTTKINQSVQVEVPMGLSSKNNPLYGAKSCAKSK